MANNGHKPWTRHQRRDLRRFNAALKDRNLKPEEGEKLYQLAGREFDASDRTVLDDIGKFNLATAQGRPVDYPCYVRRLMKEIRQENGQKERHALRHRPERHQHVGA